MRRARHGMLALLIAGGVACGANETGTPAASDTDGTPVATSSGSSPTATPSGTAGCNEATATDLTADDPYTITIHNYQFKPDCFMADFAAASIAIENKDDVAHTFSIDGTLVNAPLRPHHTYRHGPGGVFLDPGTYPFHCSIHPEITGTMIVV
jgi:plastocyanin